MDVLFRVVGTLGLLLIIVGILSRDRRRQSYFHIVGGVCLEVYSLYLLDWLFIILQLVFIVAAVYNLFRLR